MTAVLTTACFTPASDMPLPEPTRTDVLEGEICSAMAGAARPIKVLIALDTSRSVQVTDPSGSRAEAVLSLLDALPRDVEVSVAVMLFAGSATELPVDAEGSAFKSVSQLSAQDRSALRERILRFAPPGGGADGTDFVLALSGIHTTVSLDIGLDQAAKRPAAAYAVLFVSDGGPATRQDDLLLCGDAVTRVRALGELARGVSVHTAFVFNPLQPPATCNEPLPSSPSVCALPVTTAATCAAHVVDIDRDRLKRMAQLGGGEFREFRNGAPADFGFVAQRLVKTGFSLGTVVVSNLSSAPSTGEVDSDADGLTDAQEQTLGTNPDQRDSDGDGFSDGVERWVALGKDKDPTRLFRLMEGCQSPGVDSDCDGLSDCDERVLASNPSRADSDDDGLPDAVEFQHATRPELADNLTDFDVDGIPNGDEVRQHTDPWKMDPSKPESAYQYSIEPSAAAGCFRVRVENVRVPATRSGKSALLLSASLLSTGTNGRPVAATLRLSASSGQALPGFTAADLGVGCH